MTLLIYFQCILCALLGQGIQIFLQSIPKIKKRCRAANKKFSWMDWWDCDWNVVIGTFLVIALVTEGLDEILKWKPAIWEYVKFFFAFVGATGSSAAMSFLSKYDGQTMNMLDVKANISDILTGPTKTVSETITKGEEATGQQVPGPNK